MRVLRVTLCALCGLWLASRLFAQGIAPTWVLPEEGAVITGLTKVQVSLPEGINPRNIHYYLAGAYTPDFPTALRQVGNPTHWSSENGDPLLFGVLADSYRAILTMMPEAQTSLDPVAFRPISCEMTPGMEKMPGTKRGFQARPDFTKAIMMDFTGLLPGKYRLVMVVGEERVVRNIVLETTATAPVLTMESPTLAPNGCLHIQGTVSGLRDVDLPMDPDDVRPPDGTPAGDLIGSFFQEGTIPILIDGHMVGNARLNPADQPGQATTWSADVSLQDWYLMPISTLLGPGPHRLTGLYFDPLGNGVALSRVMQLPLSCVLLTAGSTREDRQLLVNTPITLNAAAVGGTEVRYKFLLETAQGAQQLRDFAEGGTMQWTPTKAGDYRITVIARERDGSRQRKMTTTLTIHDLKQTITLTATPARTAPAGSRIVFRAVVTGQDYPDCRLECLDHGQWNTIENQGSGSVVIDAPGDYQFRASVIDRDDARVVHTSTIAYTITVPIPVTGVEIERGIAFDMLSGFAYGLIASDIGGHGSSRSLPPPPPTDTITAYRTGGTRKTSYQWYSSADGIHWKALETLPDTDGHCTLEFPVTPANHFLRVEVSDANTGGKPVTASYTCSAAAPGPFTGVTLRLQQPSPQSAGTAIDLGAAAIGTASHVTYTYFVNDGNGWQQIIPVPNTAYRSTRGNIWRPMSPGNYRLRVHALDEDSGKAFDSEMEYVITEI